MKVAKLVIGIVSFVLSIVVLFQSCAVGLGTALQNNTTDTSGGMGIFVAVLMIVAGIVAIAGKKSKGGAIATSVIYVIAGILGVAATGMFKDLIIWGIINFIFAAVFIVSIFVQKYEKKAAE